MWEFLVCEARPEEIQSDVFVALENGENDGFVYLPFIDKPLAILLYANFVERPAAEAETQLPILRVLSAHAFESRKLHGLNYLFDCIAEHLMACLRVWINESLIVHCQLICPN